ncbi:MAG: carboxypeptidase-like regulatory domain-containing protein [Rhizobiaceae bacterium]|nr:carboxypeptidase-like regulatory domain-containing protein [Rhizobiaceae bacterium]
MPLFRVFVLCLVWVVAFPSIAANSQAKVIGQLLTKSDSKPAPGLTVSLVHPQFGRSVPTSSDEYGRFSFFGIPMDRDPYYLEVYWGKNLVYRQSVFISRDTVNMPPIYL